MRTASSGWLLWAGLLALLGSARVTRAQTQADSAPFSVDSRPHFGLDLVSQATSASFAIDSRHAQGLSSLVDLESPPFAIDSRPAHGLPLTVRANSPLFFMDTGGNQVLADGSSSSFPMDSRRVAILSPPRGAALAPIPFSVTYSVRAPGVQSLKIELTQAGSPAYTQIKSPEQLPVPSLWSSLETTVDLAGRNSEHAQLRITGFDSQGAALYSSLCDSVVLYDDGPLALSDRTLSQGWSRRVWTWNDFPGATAYRVKLHTDPRSRCNFEEPGAPENQLDYFLYPMDPPTRKLASFPTDTDWFNLPPAEYSWKVEAQLAGGAWVQLPGSSGNFSKGNIRRISTGGEAFPIVLVHGWNSSYSDTWAQPGWQTQQFLESHSASVYAFEYPNTGHIRSSAALLRDAIPRILDDYSLQTLETLDGVSIIAHSMGGLVTRAYVSGLASTGTGVLPFRNDVDKVVTLGTPHDGVASQALQWADMARWCSDCSIQSGYATTDMDFLASTFLPDLWGASWPSSIPLLTMAGTDASRPGGENCSRDLPLGDAIRAFRLQQSDGAVPRSSAHGCSWGISSNQLRIDNCRASHVTITDLRTNDAADQQLSVFLVTGTVTDASDCRLVGEHCASKVDLKAVRRQRSSWGRNAPSPGPRVVATEGLSGARVVLARPSDLSQGDSLYISAVTDADGNIRSTLLPGHYTGTISSQGFQTRRFSMDVPSGAGLVGAEIELLEDSGYSGLRSARMQLNGGQPLTRNRLVGVQLSCEGATEVRLAPLDSLAVAPWLPLSGTAEVLLPPDTGIHFLAAQFRASPLETTDVLVAGIQYSGTETVGGLTLTSNAPQTEFHVGDQILGVGSFVSLDSLPAGYYSVMGTAPGHRPSEEQVLEVVAGTTQALDLFLQTAPPIPAAGIVSPEPGAPFNPQTTPLTWVPGQSASVPLWYKVSLFDGPQDPAPFVTHSVGPDTSWLLPEPLPDSSMVYWRVSAIGPMGEEAPAGETRAAVVDRTPPAVSLTHAGGIFAWGDTMTIDAGATDFSPIDRWRLLLSIDGGANYPDTAYAGTQAIHWFLVPQILSQDCHLRLECEDRAGNVGWSAVDTSFAIRAGSSGVPAGPGHGDPPVLTFPNPFRPGQLITFSGSTNGTFELSVFDLTGRRVRRLNDDQHEGATVMQWDGRDERMTPLPAGLYFVRLATPGRVVTRRLALLR